MRITDKNRFPKLDTKATAHNADTILREYPRYWAIAHRAFLQSPQFDSIPSTSFDPSRAEHVIIDSIDATQFVIDCDCALRAVKEQHGDELSNILCWLYFQPLESVSLVIDRFNMSHSAFYRRRDKALCAFAGAFPDTWGELIAYKGGE